MALESDAPLRLSFGVPTAALGLQPSVAVLPLDAQLGATSASLAAPVLAFGVPDSSASASLPPPVYTFGAPTGAPVRGAHGRQRGLTAAQLAASKRGDPALDTVGGVAELLGAGCKCGQCRAAVSSAYGGGGAGQAGSLLRSAQAVRKEWWPLAARAQATKASRLLSMASARRYAGGKFEFSGATLGSLGVPICEGAYKGLAACETYRKLRVIACAPGGAGTVPADGRSSNGRTMSHVSTKLETLG